MLRVQHRVELLLPDTIFYPTVADAALVLTKVYKKIDNDLDII